MARTKLISARVAAVLLGAAIAAPATAQVLKITPDFEARATSLIGHEVTNSKGVEIGKVDDLLIQKDGKVGFVVLSVGRALGIGAKLVAVPYNKVIAQGRAVFYKGTPDELKNATEFTYQKHAMNEGADDGQRMVRADSVTVMPLDTPPGVRPVGPEPGAPTSLLPAQNR